MDKEISGLEGRFLIETGEKKMKENVWYVRGTSSYGHFSKNLEGMIKVEAGKGNMLAKSDTEIKEYIESGNSILALCNGNVVGFVCLINYTDSVEIAALIVNSEYRGMGIGIKLAKQLMYLSKNIYPNKLVIMFANEISSHIAIKLKFVIVDKEILDNEFWDLCNDCPEFVNFPDCHCKPMMLM
ncbi:MAG: GNAT family N-acetyltransferase [Candidatus Pacebacteria bacterium]|nr:GNAT family N-acetyltransferase [Candidatus Paceibacterota bacterium]